MSDKEQDSEKRIKELENEVEDYKDELMRMSEQCDRMTEVLNKTAGVVEELVIEVAKAVNPNAIETAINANKNKPVNEDELNADATPPEDEAIKSLDWAIEIIKAIGVTRMKGDIWIDKDEVKKNTWSVDCPERFDHLTYNGNKVFKKNPFGGGVTFSDEFINSCMGGRCGL